MCTGIKLRAKDGSVVHGRTVEFAAPLKFDIAAIPRGYALRGSTPKGNGMSWTAKYGAAGITANGFVGILDGMNEAGLSSGAFYFPTYAGYGDTTPENQMKSLSSGDFVTWVLTSFANVDEIRAAIEAGDVAISSALMSGWGTDPQPFHYIAYDKSGAALVIEPIDGRLVLYDNPMGVITNSPEFAWHMTNLRNYIDLSPVDVPPVTIDGTTFQQFGMGTGMRGLPGDITPPSRFVRAAAFSATAIQSENAQEGVEQAFHILNNFDIPVGLDRRRAGREEVYDSTQMTVVRDPQAMRYYWRTHIDQTLRFVDLAKVDFGGANAIRFTVDTAQVFVDDTAKFT